MEKLDVYKCDLCGNIVEVLHVGGGPLACCGKQMGQLRENVTDAAKEKHVPVFEGDMVKVGSVAHPMLPEHFIEWIEIVGENKVCRHFLAPGTAPESAFGSCGDGPEGSYAREYCNLHGLWKGVK